MKMRMIATNGFPRSSNELDPSLLADPTSGLVWQVAAPTFDTLEMSKINLVKIYSQTKYYRWFSRVKYN